MACTDDIWIFKRYTLVLKVTFFHIFMQHGKPWICNQFVQTRVILTDDVIEDVTQWRWWSPSKRSYNCLNCLQYGSCVSESLLLQLLLTVLDLISRPNFNEWIQPFNLIKHIYLTYLPLQHSCASLMRWASQPENLLIIALRFMRQNQLHIMEKHSSYHEHTGKAYGRKSRRKPAHGVQGNVYLNFFVQVTYTYN